MRNVAAHYGLDQMWSSANGPAVALARLPSNSGPGQKKEAGHASEEEGEGAGPAFGASEVLGAEFFYRFLRSLLAVVLRRLVSIHWLKFRITVAGLMSPAVRESPLSCSALTPFT